MTDYIQGAKDMYNFYGPKVSPSQGLKNEWETQRNQIAQDAEDNPVGHLALPFALHVPLIGAGAYGAYKLLDSRQKGMNERAFGSALKYTGAGDSEAMDAYKRVSSAPKGLGRDEWAQQLVAKGDIRQETLDRLRGLGDQANDIVGIQNRMANPVTGSMYSNFYNRMSPEELKIFDDMRASGRSITPQMVAERVGDLRRQQAALAKNAPEFANVGKQIGATDQLLLRMNRAQQAGVKPSALMGAFEDMGGVSGLKRIQDLERAGMIKTIGQRGLMSRVLGAITGKGRLR